MKKIFLFACLALASICGFAKKEFIPTPDQVLGDTTYGITISVCTGSEISTPVPPSLHFQTSCSYVCQGVRYYTTEPYIVLTFDVPNDTTIMCYVDSVNELPLNIVKAITFSVHVAPTISIPPDSIHHVTCPNGHFHPYGDGAFSVILDEPTQNYSWIKVQSDSSFFFNHTYYDDFSITGLRGGTYHVISRGITGCEYHDSVTIEQPASWGFDPEIHRTDTICPGGTGCSTISCNGGTPPYSYTWFYYSDTGRVFMDDTSRTACGLNGGGSIYRVYMYDSRGCKYGGEEIDYIITYLFDYVEDSTHLITTNPIACYGSPYLAQAQSMGDGSYTWHVGGQSDSVNYSTWVAADSALVADYYTPPVTESAWISVDFSDQHGCVTHDSVWVEVDHPEVAMAGLPEHLCVNGSFPLDLTDYTTAAPDGGNLFYYGLGLSADGLFTPTVSGSYELYVNYTDPIGCVARDTATVGIVEPEPLTMEVDTLMFTDLQYTVTAPADGILTVNGIAIPGSDGQYFIDPGQFASGYYTLHFEAVYGDYDCLSEFETAVHIVDRTRVRDFDVAVSVYPNPATTVLNLSCSEPLSLTVTLTDITGRALRTETVSDAFHTIDVTALPNGVYLLRMETPEGAIRTVKFVKR